MNTVQEALQYYHKLSMADRLTFYVLLSHDMDIEKESMQEFQTESRFSEQRACLHCGSAHFVKNGHRSDGTQRYLCRVCKKSFLISTNSIVSGTHKGLALWKRYFECMMERKTLRETSAICGISMGTAFLWRHRILDAVQEIARKVSLRGIVEADETFFNLSFKGNHRKGDFSLPRESHKRGGDTHTKGLSSEKVCVLCAVNETGASIAKTGKLGKVSSDCVKRVFSDRISPDAVLCTDHEKAYLRFAADEGIHLVQMGTDKRMNGHYSIQRINSYHSRLKGFMGVFKGVSTKYLDNYLTWNSLMMGKGNDRSETQSILFGFTLSAEKRILCRQIPERSRIPAVV